MGRKSGRHILRTLFFTLLFLLSLAIAEAPYLTFAEGSFLNAVMGPVNVLAVRYAGLFDAQALSRIIPSEYALLVMPYTLMPAVAAFEVLAVISLFGGSAAAFISWIFFVAGLFICGWCHQGVQLFEAVKNAPFWLVYVGYSLAGLSVLTTLIRLFSGRSAAKAVKAKKKKIKDQSLDDRTPEEIEKSEKELAFEKAVAGMSHDQALEILHGLEVPHFKIYPCSTGRENNFETSVNKGLFETAFRAGNIERENRSNRLREEQERKSRLDQLFGSGNLKRKLQDDVQAEFEFGEAVEVDDAFEIHTPQMQQTNQQFNQTVQAAPVQPQVIYVQQQPQVIYVNLPNASAQALPGIETKPASFDQNTVSQTVSQQNVKQDPQPAAKSQPENPQPEIHQTENHEDFRVDDITGNDLDIQSDPEPSRDSFDDDFEKAGNDGKMDMVSPVGGLRKAEGADYVYDIRKFTYQFPSETLLKHYPASTAVQPDIKTDPDGHTIVETFQQFKIDTKLIGIQHGPTFTLYELALAKGIRVNSVLTLADNLAMDLAVQSVRILAPIPGKSAIGIEVPNRKRDTIGFDEMLPELRTKSRTQHIPMVLGKTITGDRIVVDLATAPHMLIAGTTGSGKSVCVNSLICSVLYTKTPREVRMLLVDPKMVELTVYNDIPHLLTPVITDPKRAIKAMAWVVEEMERRMAIFTMMGARKIEDYNQKILNKGLARQPLPYIMVIVDEFADLMMSVGKELESYIKRITAVARFTGIHLVLATQRPDASVITGIIKSNMPTQIAFAVSNGTNSRIILDSVGAEKLLGRGDMLYAGASNRVPQRIQGAYIDPEIEQIVSFVKTQGEPDYIDESYFEDPDDDEDDSSSAETVGNAADMYTRAWRLVAEKGEASASYLQRRLGIGYNRAANLIEQLEESGCIGPARGSKPREILRYPE